MDNKTVKTFYDEIINIGLKKNLISFNEDKTKITYTYQNKKKEHRYSDPEEKVRAYIFIRLIKDYGYKSDDIALEVSVPRRTPRDLADIVVYSKENESKPYLVIECKKDGITDNEFNQAIEQVFGNANSLRAKYACVIAGNTETIFDVANFDSMEREKNVIAEIPLSYGKPINYRFSNIKQARGSLKIVSKEDLISSLEKCHDTVWQGGRLNPSDAFDEVSKILFCKLQDEKNTKSKDNYKFQIGTHETTADVAKRIHLLYSEGKKIDPYVFSEDVKLDDEIIYKVVEHLQSIDINKTDLDSKGVAFERFMGDFFKGKMGQYFTPREIVDFCVKMLDIKNTEKVLDTACGSGGFLLHAMDSIRKEGEESFDDELNKYRHWRDFASNKLFGIEINEQIARVCKMNMIIHDDGHTNVISTDALSPIENHTVINRGFKKESFDVILTNPPFGAKILRSEKSYLKDYELGRNAEKERVAQSTEILFIERCFSYLKEGGRMAIVLPDGILTNTSLQYVRDFIMDKAKIDAVVSIPQTAFSHYGAGVKCSLLFLTKTEKYRNKEYDIFMATAEDVGYDATGRRTDKNDLKEIEEIYKKSFKKKTKVSGKCFLVKSSDVLGNRLTPSLYLSDIKECKFEKIKFHTIIESLSGGATPHLSRRGDDNPYTEDIKSGVPFLRIQNITEKGIDLNDVKYITKSIHDNELARSRLSGGDIVLTITGRLGTTVVIPNGFNGNMNQHSVRVRLNDAKKNLKEYIAIYFNSSLGQKEVWKYASGGTRSAVDYSAIKNFEIPMPPKNIQDDIVKIMQDAYSKKDKLEKEADELLASIDSYVLGELGIEVQESQKKEKCFFVKSSEVKAKRWDIKAHSIYPKTIKNAILKSSYKAKIISELIINSYSGDWGNDIDSIEEKYVENYINIEVIRNTNFSNTFNINNSKKAMRAIEKKKLKATSLNDILIEKSGGSPKQPVGRVMLVTKELEGYGFSNFLNLISINQDVCISPFLFSYLRSLYSLNFTEYMESQTTGIKNLIMQEFLDISVPIPPIEIQEEIANEAQRRRDKAFKLQEEAKAALENAKKEVEDILF